MRGVTPPPGSVVEGGAPDAVWEMDAGNSIEIAWRWELVTAERGTIRPSLYDAEGRPVPGQLWSAKSVEGAGPGTGASRAAVRCNESNGAYEREVAAIHYTLRDGDTLLAEGTKPLAPPIRFRCAAFDMLEVLAVTPPGGVVWGMDEGESHQLFRPGRSVRVRYRYHVASVPEAVLKHGLMLDRHRPVPGNISTLPRVSEGTGMKEVPLSRACAHSGLPDVRARFIHYRLIDPDRDATLREGYHPVDLVFTCRAPRVGPGTAGETLRDRRLRPGSTGGGTLAPGHAVDPAPSLRGEEEPRLRGAPPVRRIPAPGPGSDSEEQERIERPRHDPALRP